MNYQNGTVTFGSTGIKTITTTFQPLYIRLTVGQAFGSTDTDTHLSIGSGTATKYHVHSIFNDTVNALTFDSASYVLYHLEFDGVNVSPVLTGTIDSLNATSFKINVSLADATYQIYWEAFS